MNYYKRDTQLRCSISQGHREPKEQVERAATDIATIMYTSGTTGKPKVRLSELWCW
jgi:long-subunit acyl-CoA synthetase (AMP-forming)